MTAQFGARTILIVLLVIAVGLLFAITAPFGRALFLAAVLAGAISPLYERLTHKLRGRRNLAAAIATLLLVLVVVIPIATVAGLAIKEALDGAAFVRDTLKSEGVAGLVERLPGPLQSLGERVVAEMPQAQSDIEDIASTRGGQAAAAVGAAMQTTSTLLLQTAMMLIAFFFFLVDGKKLIRWVDHTLPLKHVQLVELLGEFRRVSVAVLVSSLATAGVQATAAFIGYMIVRVPNALFFALLTFFIGLIPAVGAAVVVLAVALLMLLSGHPGAAIFLAIYGVVVVGLVDNIVKPLLIKGEVELHGAVVFFSLLGGLAVFGAVGLIAGPAIVSFFLTVVKLVRRELGQPTVIEKPTEVKADRHATPHGSGRVVAPG